MSRLHNLRAAIDTVACLFDAQPVGSIAIPSETVEGLSGLVMYEAGDVRRLRLMRWGFPRMTREGRLRGEEPGIIGLVADLTNAMWEQLVVDARYRCVIPITHFANPDGVPGERTRTWFRVSDQPVMAWAGFCRNIPEIGPVYAGMTMEANEAIRPANDRMPALLDYDEIDRWLHGSIADVIGFQFRPPFAAERMVSIPTEDAWRSGTPPPMGSQLGLI